MTLDSTMINDPNGQVSIIARDVTEYLASGAPIPKDDSPPQVGTISFNVEYFRNVTISQYGTQFTQWITLFDDVDDDEYDGDLGEDDEELPMIKTTFTIGAIEEPKQPSPERKQAPAPSPVKKEIAPPTQAPPNMTANRASPKNLTTKSGVVGSKVNTNLRRVIAPKEKEEKLGPDELANAL